MKGFDTVDQEAGNNSARSQTVTEPSSTSDICLSRQVLRPNAFYLADADPRQPSSLCNATPAAFKGNDLFMHRNFKMPMHQADAWKEASCLHSDA